MSTVDSVLKLISSVLWVLISHKNSTVSYNPVVMSKIKYGPCSSFVHLVFHSAHEQGCYCMHNPFCATSSAALQYLLRVVFLRAERSH